MKLKPYIPAWFQTQFTTEPNGVHYKYKSLWLFNAGLSKQSNRPVKKLRSKKSRKKNVRNDWKWSKEAWWHSLVRSEVASMWCAHLVPSICFPSPPPPLLASPLLTQVALAFILALCQRKVLSADWLSYARCNVPWVRKPFISRGHPHVNLGGEEDGWLTDWL